MDYWYAHWGPFLFRTQVTEDECRVLLKEGNKYRKKSNDYRHELAGQLSEEYQLEDTKSFVSWFGKYINIYSNAYNKWRHQNPQNITLNNPFVVDARWINYMKANDFNPPHDHHGDLSFVIFLQIPKDLNTENKEYKGRSCGPGGITFVYGDGTRQATTQHDFYPKEKDIFIFPAWLKHWVYPFKSNIERISVSGNILLS